MGSGELPGLQNQWKPLWGFGGFDPHTLPPTAFSFLLFISFFCSFLASAAYADLRAYCSGVFSNIVSAFLRAEREGQSAVLADSRHRWLFRQRVNAGKLIRLPYKPLLESCFLFFLDIVPLGARVVPIGVIVLGGRVCARSDTIAGRGFNGV